MSDLGKSDNPRAKAFEGTVFVSHPELFFSFGFCNYGQLSCLLILKSLKSTKKFRFILIADAINVIQPLHLGQHQGASRL